MRRSAQTRFVLIALATFFMSVVPTVQARTCSSATAAGTWGFTTTGVFFFPPSPFPVPIVNVGIFTDDRAGHFVGSQTRNVAGMVADETIKGTFTVNSDCTGTIVANAFDPSSGALIGTSTLSVVLVDDARKLRAIFIKSVDPQGNPLLGVLSAEGERVLARDEVEGGRCTLATLKGSWGSLINGTILGVGPIAVAGLAKFHGDGTFSMDATAVVDGNVFPDQTTGTYTVNDDCTGTTMDSLGDSSKFVIVGNRTEVLAISTKQGVVATLQLTKQ
jgi:hypothetical protein